MAQRFIDRREKHTRSQLLEELREAARRAAAASQEFDLLINDLPTGTLQPDAVQRIHDAPRRMIAAQIEWRAAVKRLNDFVNDRILPEDLKRGLT